MYEERGSVSSYEGITNEDESKHTMRDHYRSIRVAKTEKLAVSGFGKNVE